MGWRKKRDARRTEPEDEFRRCRLEEDEDDDDEAEEAAAAEEEEGLDRDEEADKELRCCEDRAVGVTSDVEDRGDGAATEATGGGTDVVEERGDAAGRVDEVEERVETDNAGDSVVRTEG